MKEKVRRAGYEVERITDMMSLGFLNHNEKGSTIVGMPKSDDRPPMMPLDVEERIRSGRYGNFPLEALMVSRYGSPLPNMSNRTPQNYMRVVNEFLPKTAVPPRSKAVLGTASNACDER